MARSLSLLKRRPNLIDLGIRTRANVKSYQFERAANFDGAFSALATIPATGYKSATVPDVTMAESSTRGYTRFVFNPVDYTLDDNVPHWIRIKQVHIDGTVGAAEAMHLVLPFNSQPNRLVVVAGTAPGSGSQTGSYELQLPGHCYDLSIQVEGTTPMMVAFESGGPEMKVLDVPSTFMSYKSGESGFSQVWIRGAGVATAFNMTFALRQPAR